MNNVNPEKLNNKDELRKHFAKLRDGLDDEERKILSSQIADRLFNSVFWNDYDTIFSFVTLGSEPETEYIIERAFLDGKCVCVPRIFGKEMRFIEIKDLNELFPGTYGIPEPADGGIYEDGGGLVIVPGLAFGYDFSRVGYGAGYYDKFFEGHSSSGEDGYFLAGICFDFQLCDDISTDDFDVRMDALITDRQVIISKDRN